MIRQGFILLFILCTINATGQLTQTARYELEIDRYKNPFFIVPADSSGLFLFHETEKFADNNKQYELTKLNTDLVEKGKLTIDISNKFNWIGYDYSTPELYFLFRQGEHIKSDFHIIRFGEDINQITRFDIKNEMEFDVTHFSISVKTAIMGGYVNNRPAILLYDFANEKVKILPGFYKKDSKLLDITLNINNSFNVLVYDEESSKEKNLLLKVYDWEGNLLAEDEFYVPENRVAFSGLTSRLENDHLIITGTYGSSNSKLSEGIYWAKADVSKKQYIKMIPFGNINSFFSHLPEKKQEKVKEKIKESGKDFVHKDYFALHQIKEKNGKYYLLGEIFNPSYLKTQPNTNPYTSRYRMDPYTFSRYRPMYSDVYNTKEYSSVEYLESVLITLNENGDVLWDEGLVFSRIESEDLKQVSDFAVVDDKVALAYKDEDIFRYKIVKQDEVIVSDTATNIKLGESSDVLRDEDKKEGGIKHWYKGIFFMWGNQGIKRFSDGSKDRLYVFYINKLEVK